MFPLPCTLTAFRCVFPRPRNARGLKGRDEKKKKVEERSKNTVPTMADSLIDVGKRGEENRVSQSGGERGKKFPIKEKEKRATTKSRGTKSPTFSPVDRSILFFHPPEGWSAERSGLLIPSWWDKIISSLLYRGHF